MRKLLIMILCLSLAGCASNTQGNKLNNNDEASQTTESKVTTTKKEESIVSTVGTTKREEVVGVTTAPEKEESKESEVSTVTTTKKDNTSSSRPSFMNTKSYYDRATKTLYYELDSSKTQDEQTLDIMNTAVMLICDGDWSKVSTVIYDLDEAIRTGSTYLEFRGQDDGVWVDRKEFASILVTTGTYKGYSGSVYSGDTSVGSTPSKTQEACSLIGTNKLSCPDGEWDLVEVNGQMMIQIDNRDRDNAFDTSIRHNGYDGFWDYALVDDVSDTGGNYWYSSYTPDHLYDQYQSATMPVYDYNSWTEWLDAMKSHEMVVFTRTKEGFLYEHEIPEMDEKLVQCTFNISRYSSYSYSDAVMCPYYVKKYVLGWDEETIAEYSE